MLGNAESQRAIDTYTAPALLEIGSFNENTLGWGVNAIDQSAYLG